MFDGYFVCNILKMSIHYMWIPNQKNLIPYTNNICIYFKNKNRFDNKFKENNIYLIIWSILVVKKKRLL